MALTVDQKAILFRALSAALYLVSFYSKSNPLQGTSGGFSRDHSDPQPKRALITICFFVFFFFFLLPLLLKVGRGHFFPLCFYWVPSFPSWHPFVCPDFGHAGGPNRSANGNVRKHCVEQAGRNQDRANDLAVSPIVPCL